MEKHVFAVYDSVAATFMLPFFSVRVGMAIRDFTNAVNSSSSDLSRNYKDVTLFQLGMFDEETAIFTTGEPVRVISGIEVHKEDF